MCLRTPRIYVSFCPSPQKKSHGWSHDFVQTSSLIYGPPRPTKAYFIARTVFTFSSSLFTVKGQLDRCSYFEQLFQTVLIAVFLTVFHYLKAYLAICVLHQLRTCIIDRQPHIISFLQSSKHQSRLPQTSKILIILQ